MPQIDKVIFLTIVYWIFAFYFFLYLDLNVTYLYKFLTRLKLNTQRLLETHLIENIICCDMNWIENLKEYIRIWWRSLNPSEQWLARPLIFLFSVVCIWSCFSLLWGIVAAYWESLGFSPEEVAEIRRKRSLLYFKGILLRRYQALEAKRERLSFKSENFFEKIGSLTMKFVINPLERVVINLLLAVVDLLLIVRNGFVKFVRKLFKKVKYFFKMKKR